MCGWNLFHNDLRVCMELQVLSKTVSRLWFYAFKKYKNGNSVRRTATRRHILPAICSSGSDNFSSGISGKLPIIATSNVIFSRTADRIAAKFCMTIKKIKPNDIFENCVHSCSALISDLIYTALQLMKTWGAEVATTCSTDAVDLVASLGADHVIDYQTEDVRQRLNDIKGYVSIKVIISNLHALLACRLWLRDFISTVNPCMTAHLTYEQYEIEIYCRLVISFQLFKIRISYSSCILR